MPEKSGHSGQYAVSGKNICIRDFIGSADSEPVMLVCDFDGTLYRGLIPLLWQGLSAADLGMVLCLRNLLKPAKMISMAAAMIRLSLLKARLHWRYLSHRTSRSSMDMTVISTFVRTVLKKTSDAQLRTGAKLLSHAAYPGAVKCLQHLSEKMVKTVIISKAFQAVLEEWAAHLQQGPCKKPELYGVRLHARSPLEIDYARSVTSREDKRRTMQAVLKQTPEIKKVLVVGDTEEDLGLFDGAREILGNEQVFLIAVHSKDSPIRRAAHVNAASWKHIHKLLVS